MADDERGRGGRDTHGASDPIASNDRLKSSEVRGVLVVSMVASKMRCGARRGMLPLGSKEKE